jgi:hypothetical protein
MNYWPRKRFRTRQESTFEIVVWQANPLRLVLECLLSVHKFPFMEVTPYWTESEQKLHQRLGIGAAWTQVIDRLTNWLSENQELSAPRYVLDEYPTETAALASQHFLVLVDNRYRFFHGSLFDYAFARRFAARGERLVNLLTTSEQHLFRRSQVRQVLSLYRSTGDDRY